MPKLKQPSPLLKMAKDRLVDLLAKRCNDCSMNGSLDELRQVVAFIKADIGPKIPWQMEADFFESFSSRYGFRPRAERPVSHKRAVLEVIMDRKIAGLSVSSDLLESMDLKNARRFQGLSTLDLNSFRRYNLETFHLEDLKKFLCDYRCTDAYLRIIGKNCPKLEHLSIVCSEQVTDKGLVALNKCTELRIAHFGNCPKITYRGIQQFLEAHEKIEKIDFDFKFFSYKGWSVYPSITHYGVDFKNITDSNLRLIGKKFPNLTSLRLSGELDDSSCFTLTTLRSLKKLTDLHFEFEGDVFVWKDFKPLLRSIGANIKKLRTSSLGNCASDTYATQADLNFLHKFCPNIETLTFNYNAERYGQMFVIPPFRRLKELECINPSEYPDYARLQFGVMANLEKLHIENVEMTTETLESMVLDNDKFPVLNCINIDGVSSVCDLIRIRKIVENNNIHLNLTVT